MNNIVVRFDFSIAIDISDEYHSYFIIFYQYSDIFELLNYDLTNKNNTTNIMIFK